MESERSRARLTRVVDTLGRVAPPVACFVAARCLLLASARSIGNDAPLGEAWARWDSLQYIDIAMRGYNMAWCPTDSRMLCGNTGWLPGYPYLMRPLMWAGLDYWRASAVIPGAFTLGLLVLVWERWLKRRCTTSALLSLLAVALGLGAIYQHASFPVSMLLFFAVLQATYVGERRWLAAGLAGAAGAFSYSTGFLLAPIAAGCVLLDRELPRGRRIAIAAAIACATFAGFLAVLGIHYMQLGRWDAFFTVQGNYGHQIQNPLATLVELVRKVRGGNELASLEGLHVAASAVLVIGVLTACVLSWRVTDTVLDRWAGMYVLLFFAFPLALGSGVAPVRAASLLAPSVVVVRWLPRPVLLAWMGLAAWLAYQAGRLYFADVLI